MIISASRRCDVPNYKSDWFLDSLKAGEILLPTHSFISKKITLRKDIIDCIVFWTKNPEPMIPRIHELDGYPYYFQFTITGYGKRIEPGVPDKRHMLDVFCRLADEIAPMPVIWRYDPIAISPSYTVEYHKSAFRQIVERLEGKSNRCVISFIDIYGKVQNKVSQMQFRTPTIPEIEDMCSYMAEIARQHGMVVETCSERLNLLKYGIQPTHCIDANLIEQITGKDAIDGEGSVTASRLWLLSERGCGNLSYLWKQLHLLLCELRLTVTEECDWKEIAKENEKEK